MNAKDYFEHWVKSRGYPTIMSYLKDLMFDEDGGQAAIATIMEAYHRAKVGAVTDEVIETEINSNALQEFGINVKGFYLEQRQHGAKWLRNKLLNQ